jgi:hemoglobin
MTVMTCTRALVALTLAVAFGGCASTGSSATSLFNQLGGMDQIRSLSSAFVDNAARDGRTSNLLSNANLGSLKTKVSDQLCAMSGGSCKAPLTGAQITEAGKKVDAGTSSALTDSLRKALDAVRANPAVKESTTKLLGPQLGGIVAGLL